MESKVVFLICAQIIIAQCITSQCIGAYNGLAWDAAAPWGGPSGYPYTADPWDATPWGAPLGSPYADAWAGPCGDLGIGYAPAALAASNGGGFPISSASPIAVTGVYMTSENVYEGPLAVSGAVPFLGSVSLEGALPTVGAGAVTYGCGNGNVGMLSEDFAGGLPFYTGAYGYGPGIAELGYGYGAPLGFDAAIAGPYGYGGCGYGARY